MGRFDGGLSKEMWYGLGLQEQGRQTAELFEAALQQSEQPSGGQL